jgi:hypothetical protein
MAIVVGSCLLNVEGEAIIYLLKWPAQIGHLWMILKARSIALPYAKQILKDLVENWLFKYH